MIKLVSETIDRDDINALIEWLSQDPIPQLTKGPLTRELESKWAKKIGTKYSVFVNSGSSAILLLLAALKESGNLKNNKVVVPALSWATDVSSPILLDMHPIMCDCNLHDLSCDLKKLRKIFIEHNPSCFLLVSPLGLVPDMDELVKLCEEYDVLLLEDVCESMGSKYKNEYLGSFGFASMFSTYFGHHISTIEGGFINTNDEGLYHHLLMMRSHGWNRDLPKEVQEDLNHSHGVSKFKALYTFYVPGMNLRSTDLQAFLGLRAIDKLDVYSENRNKNFKLYYLLLKNNILKLELRDTDYTSNFAYPIVSYNRDRIIQELSKNNIDSRPLIAGNMANNPFWNERYQPESFPNAELIDKYGFYIPNHQDLTKTEIETVTTIINENWD
jgi:CDP-6-deoxy-D-xylo-4-hexulose-3-dehydrase